MPTLDEAAQWSQEAFGTEHQAIDWDWATVAIFECLNHCSLKQGQCDKQLCQELAVAIFNE